MLLLFKYFRFQLGDFVLFFADGFRYGELLVGCGAAQLSVQSFDLERFFKKRRLFFKKRFLELLVFLRSASLTASRLSVSLLESCASKSLISPSFS